MKLYEEFKLFENMWKDLYNDDGEYIGPMEKCAKCGQDTPKLIGGAAIKTPFGIYCSKCFAELQDNPDDLLVYNLSVDYNNSEWIKASIDGHVNYGYGEDFIADTISAWNKAKKDPRFVLTAGEVAKIEQGFIASAKKCGININFLSNTSNKEIRAVNENNKIMKITKSELKEMIKGVLREELSQLKESAAAEKFNETFNVSKSDGHFSIVQFAKNIHDNLIANNIDCVVSLESGYKIKVECNNFNKVDDIVKNTKELIANKITVDVEDHGKYRLYMLK